MCFETRHFFPRSSSSKAAWLLLPLAPIAWASYAIAVGFVAIGVAVATYSKKPSARILHEA